MNTTLSSIYKHWLWIGVPLMLLTAAALGYLIPGLIATVRKAQLFRVPLVARQTVQFDEAGTVALNIEGRQLTTAFAKLSFDLSDETGVALESRNVWLRTRSSGVTQTRLEILKYDIPRPGKYVLGVNGLDAPQAGDSRNAIVFTRPMGFRLPAYIVGIVLSACVFIASLVFVILRLREP